MSAPAAAAAAGSKRGGGGGSNDDAGKQQRTTRRLIRAVIFDLGGTLAGGNRPMKKQGKREGVEAMARVVVKQYFSGAGIGHVAANSHASSAAAAAAAAAASSDGRVGGTSSSSSSSSIVNEAVFADAWRATLSARKAQKNEFTASLLLEKTASTMLRETLEKLGVDPAHISEERLDEALRANFAPQIENAQLFDGVPEMLMRLKRDGYRCALLTNAADSVKQRALIEKFELEKYLHPIVISSDAGVRKPDNRFFQLVLDAWAAEDPPFLPERHEIVMVGDMLNRDILGARWMGMKSVLVTTDADSRKDNSNVAFEGVIVPDAEIDAISKLPDVLSDLHSPLDPGHWYKFRKFRVGYLFTQKKARKFRQAGLFNWPLYRQDVTCAQVDPHGDLEAQGPFDVLLVKLTDVMADAHYNGDAAAKELMDRLQRWFDRHPEMAVVNSFDEVAPVLDRASVYNIIVNANLTEAAGHPVRIPRSVIVNIPQPGSPPRGVRKRRRNSQNDSSSAAAAAASAAGEDGPCSPDNGFDRPTLLRQQSLHADASVPLDKVSSLLRFPIIAKTLRACGSKDAHSMYILPREESLSELQPGQWLLQNFINHDRMLFKVYVLGHLTHIASKLSIPNISPDQKSILQFNSQQMVLHGDVTPGSRPSSPTPNAEAKLGTNEPVFDDANQQMDISDDNSIKVTPTTVAEMAASKQKAAARHLHKHKSLASPVSLAVTEDMGGAAGEPEPEEDEHDNIKDGNQMSSSQQASFSSSQSQRRKHPSISSRNIRLIVSEAKSKADGECNIKSIMLNLPLPFDFQGIIQRISFQLSQSLSVSLFGYDVICDRNTGEFFIIDINYFPSFAGMPHFSPLLLEMLVNEQARHMRQLQQRRLISEGDQELLNIHSLHPGQIHSASGHIVRLPSGLPKSVLQSRVAETIASGDDEMHPAVISAAAALRSRYGEGPAHLLPYAQRLQMESTAMHVQQHLQDVRQYFKRIKAYLPLTGAAAAVAPSGISSDVDEWVTIAGYGSLLNKVSAQRTCPGLRNFRLCQVRGFRRIFNLVSVSQIRDGLANWDTMEVAAVSAEPVDDPSMSILCSLFEIPRALLGAYFAREHRYKYVQVQAEVIGEGIESAPCNAIMCISSTDEEYRKKFASEHEYFRHVGHFYRGALWGRSDILPGRRYLNFCMRAAASLGQSCIDNFLDTTFLADGATTLREYLHQYPDRAPSTGQEHHN